MRSYSNHLELLDTKVKPVCKRASAIFPIFEENGIHTRISFLNYWSLKRDLKLILLKATIRNEEGTELFTLNQTISEKKTYRVDIKEFLSHHYQNKFIGTIEVVFSSEENLVFPFPAVIVNYYNDYFSSVVHTSQRLYNNEADLNKNSSKKVPESGFNIHANRETEPIITIINGENSIPSQEVKLNLINFKGETKSLTISSSKLNPYQVQCIYPSRLSSLEPFLENRAGTCKIEFPENKTFPRLIVGNLNKNIPAINVTHTYYDCSKQSGNSDYWTLAEKGHDTASLSVPIMINNQKFSKIYFYPIISPSELEVDLQLFTLKGQLVHSAQKILTINQDSFSCIDIQNCLESIETGDKLVCRLSTKPINNSKTPSRIQIGLDIGKENKGLACNICTNLQLYDPKFDNKPSTFKWAPFLPEQKDMSLWIINGSSEIDYSKKALVNIEIFREKDEETFCLEKEIPANGAYVLSLSPTIKDFLQGYPGWVTMKSHNKNISSYYFIESEKGIIGADHGF